MYNYKALITRVVDGDTFDAQIDLGFNIQANVRIRLAGIDTPETWRPKSDAELQHGLQATEFVKNLIEKRTVTITTYKTGSSIYGRWSASLTTANNEDLARLLKDAGFAKLDVY